jgi:hypothetical protein
MPHRKHPESRSALKRRLLESIATLIKKVQNDEWPKSMINFGGEYRDLTAKERRANPQRFEEIKRLKGLEKRRRLWMESLRSTLTDARRYMNACSPEAVRQLEESTPWIVFTRQPHEVEPKGFLTYLAGPVILRDLEDLKTLIGSAKVERLRPGRTAKAKNRPGSLSVPSVLFLIAREAHRDKQTAAAEKIGMPQPHISRLEVGQRAWTTKSLTKCLPYILSAPKNAISDAFFALVKREFPAE